MEQNERSTQKWAWLRKDLLPFVLACLFDPFSATPFLIIEMITMVLSLSLPLHGKLLQTKKRRLPDAPTPRSHLLGTASKFIT